MSRLKGEIILREWEKGRRLCVDFSLILFPLNVSFHWQEIESMRLR